MTHKFINLSCLVTGAIESPYIKLTLKSLFQNGNLREIKSIKKTTI